MKTTLKYLFFIIIIFSCGSSNDDDEQFNPNDLDGDGVTNQQEVIDGTIPEDACSFLVSSIYLPSASNTWKNSDCDGDGMTNRKELDLNNDGQIDSFASDPLNPCSINLNEEQDTNPSIEWKTSDCDGDGVSNEQEKIDGTNLKLLCDFVLEHQDSVPTVEWKNTDCDGDGRTNSHETYLGTDPLDPNDFVSSMGDKITRMYTAFSYGDDEKFWELTFSDNGNKLDKFYDMGNQVSQFQYDNNNRLILVNSNHEGNTFEVSFEYDNLDRIISLTILDNNAMPNTFTKTYTYENNYIYSHNEAGQIIQRYTINNFGKIESIRDFYPFYDINNIHDMQEKSFYYDDASFNNLHQIIFEDYQYNIISGSYELINDPDYIIRRTYSQNDKPNFAYDAFSNIYLNYFLAPEILDSFPYMSNSHEGLFDNNLTVYITEGYEDFPPNVIFSISGSFNEYQGNNLIYKSAGSQVSWIFYEYEY